MGDPDTAIELDLSLELLEGEEVVCLLWEADGVLGSEMLGIG